MVRFISYGNIFIPHQLIYTDMHNQLNPYTFLLFSHAVSIHVYPPMAPALAPIKSNNIVTLTVTGPTVHIPSVAKVSTGSLYSYFKQIYNCLFCDRFPPPILMHGESNSNLFEIWYIACHKDDWNNVL